MVPSNRLNEKWTIGLFGYKPSFWPFLIQFCYTRLCLPRNEGNIETALEMMAVFVDNPQTDPETRIPYHDGEAGLPLVGALHLLQLGDLPLRLLHKVTVAQPGHLEQRFCCWS